MSKNNDNPQSENVSPAEQSQAGSEEPNFDVIAPEFEISTESFDPTIVHKTSSKEEK